MRSMLLMSAAVVLRGGVQSVSVIKPAHAALRATNARPLSPSQVHDARTFLGGVLGQALFRQAGP